MLFFFSYLVSSRPDEGIGKTRRSLPDAEIRRCGGAAENRFLQFPSFRVLFLTTEGNRITAQWATTTTYDDNLRE